MSRDGYGVAEHLVFPLSAWVGLITVVILAELQVGARETYIVNIFVIVLAGLQVGARETLMSFTFSVAVHMYTTDIA